MSVLSRAASSSPQQKSAVRRLPASKAAPKSKLRHEDSQVEFTAVESSSPVAMESQLLTEHQREVKSRQQFETAPLYPEFSSSPGPRRRASKSGLPLLDFSSQQVVMDTGYATPTLNDDHGPMDEFITSSPTPKAAEKVQQPAVENTDVDESAFEAEDNNIPSSPPEMEDETVYDGTTELENLQTTEQQGMSDVRFDTVPEDFSTIVPQEESRIDDSRVLPEEAITDEQAANVSTETHPSIRRLAQQLEGGVSSDVYTDARSELNREASAINDGKDCVEAVEEMPEDQDAAQSNDSSPIPFTDSLSEQIHQEPISSANPLQSKVSEAVATPGDISRVMDSFVGTTSDDDDAVSVQKETHTSPPPKPSTASSASKRKREEPQETRTSAKRRKSGASPFRRIVTRTLSYLTGSQVAKEDDDDDDEEMQDCIVVESQKDQEEDQEEESQSETAEQSPMPESAPASVAPSTTTRGRGRPKKSTTPVVPSPASIIRTRAAKRRASTLDAEENQESLVIDTPAPIKSRRTTRSQDAKADQTVEHVMLSPTRRRRGRELEAVLVSPGPSGIDATVLDETVGHEQEDETAADEQEDETKDDESDDQADDAKDDNREADSQLRHEEEQAVSERPPDRGNWLIARLKSIMINCTEMVLTPQQERDLQDILYELGKCVYEAGRRSSN